MKEATVPSLLVGLVLCLGSLAGEPAVEERTAGVPPASVRAGETPAVRKVFVLSSFEPGGADFVKGDGEIVQEHATDGTHAAKLKNDKAAWKKLAIETPQALAQFKNYARFRADVFNPQDAPVAFGVRMDDPQSSGFNSRFNEDDTAPPGKSTLSVELKSVVRSRGLESLDRGKLRLVSIFLSPGPKETVLFFDNLRLEGSADEKLADALLFDFESEADIAAWTPMPSPPWGEGGVRGQPAAKIEWSTEGATSGKHSLKLTFGGGDWPVVSTARIPVPGTWKEFETLKMDLTVDRPSVAYERVCQGKPDEKGQQGYWEKTMILEKGRNEVVLLLHHTDYTSLMPERGEVTSIILGMFRPQDGQVLLVDNVRLSYDWPEPHSAGGSSPYNPDGYSMAKAREFQRTKSLPKFKVLGTDREVPGLSALADAASKQWVKPAPKTVEQAEAEFKARFEALKKDHPKALLAILREGDKGCAPANPDRVYSGWKYIYLNSHGPDGPNPGREAVARPKADQVEVFMRHRSTLLRADLSSIPKGAAILAARLLIARVPPQEGGERGANRPNYWAAELCNRDWDDQYAHCYFYARGKPWKAVNGTYYGEDPDFWPLYAPLGAAGTGVATDWDFTAAVKFWLDGQHENHGFFLNGDSNDYLTMFTPAAKDVKLRPALMVVYEPKE